MKKETKKKNENNPIAHTNEFCLNSTTLLTDGWKGIRSNVFRICNYNQKTNQKKNWHKILNKKMSVIFNMS